MLTRPTWRTVWSRTERGTRMGRKKSASHTG